MPEQHTTESTRPTVSRFARLGRGRVRAAIGLILAATLAIPGGVALADTIGKLDPPAPVVPKSDPPEPVDPSGGEASEPEAGADDGALATEPPLADPALEAPPGAVESEAETPVDPPVDPAVAEEVAKEPAVSSAKEISRAGDSLDAVDESGLAQQGAEAPGVDEDPASTATARGDIALAGSQDAKGADWVIVGLSAPLSTSGSEVNVIGASWDALPKGVDVKVELRELIKGAWSEWSGIEVEDVGESGSGRATTEPYVSVAASDLQVRLLTSDGSTPKNASVDLIGDSVAKRDAAAAVSGADANTTVVAPATPGDATLGGAQADAAGSDGLGGDTAPGASDGTSVGDAVINDAAQASGLGQGSIATAAWTAPNSDDGVVSADTGELVTPEDPADGDDVDVTPVAAKSISQPVIKSRAAWGAAKPHDPYRKGRVSGVVIHHTAGSNNYTAAQVPAILRSIQAYHQRKLGWNDIGYNFLIDKFGTIWEGRAGGVTQAVVGAQALHMNAVSSGISVLGTYTSAPPSSAALNSVAKLTAWKLNVHGVSPWGSMTNRGKKTSTIIGHRDAPGNSTACPGNAFYAKLGWVRTKARDLTPAGFVFTGKGSGHGVGMQLYGAAELANQKKNATQILQHYYSGASVSSSWTNPTLRVQLVKTGSATTVTAKSGSMRLVSGSKRYGAKAITFYLRSKVLYAKIGTKVHRAPAGGFQVQWTGTRFWSGKAGVVQVQRAASNSGSVNYRYGRMLVTNIKGALNIVNEVKLNNEYVYGVAAMSSRWPAAAMQATAIASRTFALRAYNDLKGKPRADCNCQLFDDSGISYRGWSKAGEKTYGAKWQAAVNATRTTSGYRLLTYRGAPIVVNFSSSSGGKTQYRQDAFGGSSYPYYTPRADSYSLTKANPYRSWRVTLTPSQLAVRLKLPNVVELKVLRKASSGAVTGIQARSSNGTVKTVQGTSEAVRKALGLRSAYFSVARS